MQISPPREGSRTAVRPGDLVFVPRTRWRIVHIRPYENCQVVTLRGVAAAQLGLERRVLLPFDRIHPLGREPGPRRVRAVTWRRACRALIAADGPPGSLRAARSARIDLLAHQLEPAMAILRGLGTRVLLADEVGLGKTIQAGPHPPPPPPRPAAARPPLPRPPQPRARQLSGRAARAPS